MDVKNNYNILCSLYFLISVTALVTANQTPVKNVVDKILEDTAG